MQAMYTGRKKSLEDTSDFLYPSWTKIDVRNNKDIYIQAIDVTNKTTLTIYILRKCHHFKNNIKLIMT